MKWFVYGMVGTIAIAIAWSTPFQILTILVEIYKMFGIGMGFEFECSVFKCIQMFPVMGVQYSGQ